MNNAEQAMIIEIIIMIHWPQLIKQLLVDYI